MQKISWPVAADTLTFQLEIARVAFGIGRLNAFFEATDDDNRVGGLIFVNESDLPMTGW